MRNIALALVLLASIRPPVRAAAEEQSGKPDGAPRVYLDCSSCDESYLKKELKFADLVLDQRDADVVVIVRGQDTGSGGTKYSLRFLGAGRFAGKNDELAVTLRPDASEDGVRTELKRGIELGLVPYAVHTSVFKDLKTEFTSSGDIQKAKDRWDHWTFTGNFDAAASQEQSTSNSSLNYGFNAKRVTEGLRIQAGVNSMSSRQSFVVDGQEIASKSRYSSLSASAVKGVGGHFAAGARAGRYAYTSGNIESSIYTSPAVEYDVFPYSESVKKLLTLHYALGPSFTNYALPTVYGLTSETLLTQSIEATLALTQKWGNVTVNPSVSNALGVEGAGRAGVSSNVHLKLSRMLKGLGLDFNADLSKISGDRSLPATDPSVTEILLRTRSLPTTFSRSVRVGMSYTFGSTDNNVVNPRFGY